MSHDGDRVNLYRHFFLEQLSSLKIHERVIDKETDICFCQNVRFLFGICSLESHCSEGGFTPLLFRQQTEKLFRQAWNAMREVSE
mgnify:CR=1 FL=1